MQHGLLVGFSTATMCLHLRLALSALAFVLTSRIALAQHLQMALDTATLTDLGVHCTLARISNTGVWLLELHLLWKAPCV